MDWWKKRKRESEANDRDDADYWFSDIEEIFDRMDEEFNRMRREMFSVMEQARKGTLPNPEKGGPIVYGFSMRVGPDGIPKIEQFGNVRGLFLPGTKSRAGLEGYREPLADIIESENELSVTFELPGVEKSDIQLESTKDTVTIKVDREDRKYYKEIDLPRAVKPESAKAKFNNGVLEVTFELEEKKPKGKKISIQ